MENSPESAKTKKNKKFLSGKDIAIIIVIGILFLSIVVLFIFKQAEIRKINKAHEEEMISINDKAVETINKNNLSYLENITRVFSWTVRAEIQRQNIEQLDMMMTELVKFKNFKQVVILSSEGKVILSTDKKFQGQGFPKIVYDMIKTDVSKTSVQENGEILSVSPVFGLDKRIGSVIITFAPEKVNFAVKTNQ
jgi:L-lactate utilization protein LutC